MARRKVGTCNISGGKMWKVTEMRKIWEQKCMKMETDREKGVQKNVYKSGEKKM